MCTPHTDASKQGQNGQHSKRPVYTTATPLLENLCKSSLEWEAANRSRRLWLTALCSHTLHYHLSWVCALLPQPRAMCSRSWRIGLAWSPYSIHLAISVTRCSYLVPRKALLTSVHAIYLHHLHHPLHPQPCVSQRKRPIPALIAKSSTTILESDPTVFVNAASPKSALSPTVLRLEAAASTHLMTGQ